MNWHCWAPPRTTGDGRARARSESVRIIAGAVTYFLLVMVAGFAMGTLRELVFVPALGRALGELLETPLMLAAIFGGAWLAIGWCRIPSRLRPRLIMGMLSLALVLLAELALSPAVRGSVQAWFDSFAPLTFGLAVTLWIAHAVMPALVRR